MPNSLPSSASELQTVQTVIEFLIGRPIAQAEYLTLVSHPDKLFELMGNSLKRKGIKATMRAGKWYVRPRGKTRSVSGKTLFEALSKILPKR